MHQCFVTTFRQWQRFLTLNSPTVMQIGTVLKYQVCSQLVWRTSFWKYEWMSRALFITLITNNCHVKNYRISESLDSNTVAEVPKTSPNSTKFQKILGLETIFAQRRTWLTAMCSSGNSWVLWESEALYMNYISYVDFFQSYTVIQKSQNTNRTRRILKSCVTNMAWRSGQQPQTT